MMAESNKSERLLRKGEVLVVRSMDVRTDVNQTDDAILRKIAYMPTGRASTPTNLPRVRASTPINKKKIQNKKTSNKNNKNTCIDS